MKEDKLFVYGLARRELKKERMVLMNNSRQSKQWHLGRIKMETVQLFAMDVQDIEMLILCEFKSGFTFFFTYQDIRDNFMINYYGCIY